MYVKIWKNSKAKWESMNTTAKGPVLTADILLSISFAHEILSFLYVSLQICCMWGIMYQLQSTQIQLCVSGFYSVLLLHSSLPGSEGKFPIDQCVQGHM